jgi:hypothetical protein
MREITGLNTINKQTITKNYIKNGARQQYMPIWLEWFCHSENE